MNINYEYDKIVIKRSLVLSNSKNRYVSVLKTCSVLNTALTYVVIYNHFDFLNYY